MASRIPSHGLRIDLTAVDDTDVMMCTDLRGMAKGIVESIDMDRCRIEKKAAMKVLLPDNNAEIEPVPVSGGGRKSEPELDRLSDMLGREIVGSGGPF